MLTMNKEAIQFIEFGDYFFCAGDDGAVRFYDMQFRIIAWFEDLNAGPITSVSFANLPPSRSGGGWFHRARLYRRTSKALIVGVEAAASMSSQRRRVGRRPGLSRLLWMAAHPSAPQVASRGNQGPSSCEFH